MYILFFENEMIKFAMEYKQRGKRGVALWKILLLIKNRLEIVFLVMKISQLPPLPPV